MLLNWLLFANSTTAKTILPVLVSAQTVLLYSWYGQLKSKWIRMFVIIILSVCGGYIIYSQSRASWVGLVAGLLTLAYLGGQQQPKKQIPPSRFVSPRTSIRATATGILVVMVLAMVFLFKTGSSHGRLLIYKVIAKNVTAKDLVHGIGKGRFKATYNNWQSNYFQHHDINTKQALLADNTYYAFNDYLQLVLERGIAGMAVLLLSGIIITFLFKRLKVTAANSMTKGALASAMVLLTAALFSYPLQNIPVQVYLVLCLLMMINGMEKATNQLTKQLITLAGILTVLLLGVKEISTQKHEGQKETAIACSRIGHKKKASEQLEQLINKDYTEGNVLYLYARELYYARQTEKALAYLNRSQAYISNLETAQLFARLYEETGVMEKAEHYYRKSVYMVPNRFESRLNLAQFYFRRKDVERAKYWVHSIITLPVKIPSAKVYRIKDAAMDLIKELKKPIRSDLQLQKE
jgi:tetratricopeptide (TPR) repeat protein